MAELFYHITKLFWAFASPGNMLALWLAFGAALLLKARSGWPLQLGRIMTGSGALLMLLIMFVPFGYWTLGYLEDRVPPPRELPAHVGGIIVVGGSESELIAAARGPLYTNFSNMNRLLVFKMLAEKYPEAMLVYAGGTTRMLTAAQLRQADIARDVLGVMEMPDNRTVLFERDSRNTVENARNAAAMIGGRIKEPWILVTSAWHMPRAAATFRQQGWTIIPMPSDYRTQGGVQPLLQIDFMHNLTMLQIALREFYGLIGYYLAGNSNALFPEQ